MTKLPAGDSLCGWCSKPVDNTRPGRARKYCKQSCRQRAYELRRFGVENLWQHFETTYTHCYLCDEELDFNDQQSVVTDHMIAVAWGGRNSKENLRPVHRLCNAAKGAKLYIGEAS